MSVSPLPSTRQISDVTGQLNVLWEAFFASVYFWLRPEGASGSTVNRPKPTGSVQLYVGQCYFDTTLGYPVYVKSINPVVWVNGAGSHV